MTTKNREVTVKVPGTCGELVQGIFDGKLVHITCPIDLYSYVTINVDNGDEIKCPDDKWKSRLAMRKIFELFQFVDLGGEIKIQSEIPVSKGMASSTADIVGVCLGIATILGKKVSKYDIAKIAISIEPSDGIMFEGISLFNHREGKLIENFGESPSIKILIIDLGGYVNTLEFNKNDFTEIHLSTYNEIGNAIELVRKGIKQNDIYSIGKGATISAMCNQKILFKPELNKIIDIAMNIGAVGVNVAHSGTIIGILVNKSFDKLEILRNKIRQKVKRECRFYDAQLVNSGGRIVE